MADMKWGGRSGEGMWWLEVSSVSCCFIVLQFPCYCWTMSHLCRHLHRLFQSQSLLRCVCMHAVFRLVYTVWAWSIFVLSVGSLPALRQCTTPDSWAHWTPVSLQHQCRQPRLTLNSLPLIMTLWCVWGCLSILLPHWAVGNHFSCDHNITRVWLDLLDGSHHQLYIYCLVF